MLLRETGAELSPERIERLGRLHAEAYRRRAGEVRPLPGAGALLAALTRARIPWAIAKSGRMETAGPAIASLGVDLQRVPIVTELLQHVALGLFIRQRHLPLAR